MLVKREVEYYFDPADGATYRVNPAMTKRMAFKCYDFFIDADESPYIVGENVCSECGTETDRPERQACLGCGSMLHPTITVREVIK